MWQWLCVVNEGVAYIDWKETVQQQRERKEKSWDFFLEPRYPWKGALEIGGEKITFYSRYEKKKNWPPSTFLDLTKQQKDC